MSTDHASMRIALGAYLLGALHPAEHAQVEAHVAECPDCRAELAELAGLPGQLARVSLAEIEDIDTDTPAEPEPAALEQAVHRLARRRRVSRRRWLAAATAAVLLAAGGAAGATAAATRAGPATPPQAHAPAAAAGQTLTGTNPTTGVAARVTLYPSPAGTTVEIRLYGVARGRVCRLVAVGTDGHQETASTWRAGYDGGTTVPGATAITPDHLASLRVVAADDTRLVTLPGPA
jgi:hypothetical protein